MNLTTRPSRQARVAAALSAGLLWGWGFYMIYREMTTPGTARRMPADWLWHYRAARALLDGHDPYVVLRAVTRIYPFDANYLYPLPAAIVALPFTLIPAPWGAAVFTGVTAALLAYALTARSWWGLLVFGSVCYQWSVVGGQISPLLVAVAALPVLSGMLVIKPTIGLALATYRPSRWVVVGAATLCAVAFLVQPGWVAGWLISVRTSPFQGQYHPTIAMGVGGLLALSLLRWRRSEARLLFALACVPTNHFFYDQLALFLIPRRWWEWVGLVGLSHVAATLAPPINNGLTVHAAEARFSPPVIALLYLPCLVMVLARPNEGALPAWLERRVARIPWLRSTAAPVAEQA